MTRLALATLARVSAPTVDELATFRPELVAHCYRFLACYAEAEDAVQETMTKAWRHADGYQGRSSVRTWLYSIATRVCLDMQRAPQRRSLPMDLASPGQVPTDPSTLRRLDDAPWVGPVADAHLPATTDPAQVVGVRDSVRLAFVTALQALPPRQRAVLLLRDVLAFSAQECADLLDTTPVSVNSALVRARRTLGELDAAEEGGGDVEVERAVLARYVEAFEAYDVPRLVGLLRDDVVFSMPPFPLWLSGAPSVEQWWRGPGEVCRGSRVVTTAANGCPAAAVYHPVAPGRWEPFALHVLDVTDDGRIAGITHFMDTAVFAEFGLLAVVEA